eukprot:1463464-Rhodomonas_salina.1
MQEYLAPELIARKLRDAILCSVSQRTKSIVMISDDDYVPAQQPNLCPELDHAPVERPRLAKVRVRERIRAAAVQWLSTERVVRADTNVCEADCLSPTRDRVDGGHLGVRRPRRLKTRPGSER